MMELSNLSKEELLNLIDEYDDYVSELRESGEEFPISIYEFFDERYRSDGDYICVEDEIQNIAYLEDMRDTFLGINDFFDEKRKSVLFCLQINSYIIYLG